MNKSAKKMNQEVEERPDYKHTKLGWIPEDWDEITFADLADKKIKWSITGGPFGSDLKSEDFTKTGVRILQLQNLGDGMFLDKYKIYTSEEKADKLLACNIYPGDLILSKMGDPVARACIIPNSKHRFLMASDGIRLVPDKLEFDSQFVLTYINYWIFRCLAIRHSTGSTRQRIGLSDLKKLPFIKPPLPEQQKIAQILSTWNKTITKTEQLIVKKQERKKGLMQQLLTGKKRFKEFVESDKMKETKLGWIPQDWEEITFSEIADKKVKWSITGGPFGSDLKSDDFTETGVRILQLQNLGDGRFLDKYKIYTSQEKADKLLACNIYPGELILSKMGDPVARACMIPNSESRFLMASDGVRLVPDLEQFDSHLVLEYINYSNFRKLAIRHSTGSTRQRIGLSDLKQLPFVRMPRNEQKKIASVLSSADQEIFALQNQLTKFKEQKKGLMQKLLTGEVRVKFDES